MRILVLGAGAIGGYFGGRLIEAQGDVTFLAREKRAQQLRTHGLKVTSPLGNFSLAPKIVSAGELHDRFDLVLLSCKAYDLDSAIEAITPAMGDASRILPLLNGIAHLEKLDRRFGIDRVLGGAAHLALTLTSGGEIRHLNDFHRLIFGPRTADANEVCRELEALLTRTSIDFKLSANIEHDMWDKYVFLATLAAATCTMRASIGQISQTHSGSGFVLGLLEECVRVAVANQHQPNEKQLAVYRSQLTGADSNLTASMLRDIERGSRTEAGHVLGDMVRRAHAAGVETPLLRLSLSHLQAYESRRLSLP